MSDLQPTRLSDAEYAALVVQPDVAVNKYSRGCVAVVGGSTSYPGAPVLAAQAAARSGAGYTRLIVPSQAAASVRAHVLSVPVSACDCTQRGQFVLAAGRQAQSAAAKSDVVLIGPGMGFGPDTFEFLDALFPALGDKRAVLLDADALNLLAGDPQLRDKLACDAVVLTPHEGEAARLLGRALHNRSTDACELAARYSAYVILKGPDTLIAAPDGQLRACSAGGPELAKAGSGDVLGGMIAALLAQGLATLDAASLGVYVHGLAGKLAAAELSVHTVMPEDIISHIGKAFIHMGA